jgi:hypothetical protein
MSRPSVSVVLGVYNASWCVERALDSVMAQTVPPAEVLVCDDGSTDGTAERVERRYGERVTVLRLAHRNAAAARREGCARASGQWLAFLDADDWWTPAKLECQLDWLAGHPEVKWLSADGPFVSERGVERESWLSDYFDPVREMHGDLFDTLLQRCFPLTSSMLVERECYAAVGGMDGSIVYSHDYDLWLRLAARWPGAVLADRLVSYWTHAGALSRNFEGRFRDDLALLERIAHGDLRGDPAVRRAAADRAAAKAFQIGVLCLRTQRPSEGRALLRRAAGAGPLRRRAVALAGSLLPDASIPVLMRSRFAKALVLGVRDRPGTIATPGGAA